MSFEEEFDSTIRRKAEEEKYPFDEKNWEKASALLDADRAITRSAGLKKMYLPLSIVLVLGTAGLIAFNYLGKDETVATKILAQTPAATANQTSAQAQQTEVAAIDTDPTSEETIQQTIIPAFVNEARASHNTSETTSPSDRIASTQNPSEEKENLAKAETQNPEVLGQTSAASATNENSKNTESTYNATINNLNGSTADAGSAQNITETPEQALIAESAPAQNSSTPEHNGLTVPAENTSEVSSEQETILNAEYLSVIYTALPYELTVADLQQVPFVYLKRYDDDYYKSNRKKQYLNAELGGMYLLGWNAQNGKDGAGMNGYVGLNYGRYVSNKISISLGVQAYNIANIQQPFYLMSTKQYGFGSTEIYTRVTSNQLYYVAVPLKFNYALTSTNIIGVGVNAGYLVGANNSISNYYMLDNEQKTIGSSLHTNGIYKSTSMFNWMLTAHYKTQLGKRFGLNVEFNYGLTDIFKNTSGITTSQTPMGVRLGLVYTLFDN